MKLVSCWRFSFFTVAWLCEMRPALFTDVGWSGIYEKSISFNEEWLHTILTLNQFGKLGAISMAFLLQRLEVVRLAGGHIRGGGLRPIRGEDGGREACTHIRMGLIVILQHVWRLSYPFQAQFGAVHYDLSAPLRPAD